MATLLLVDPDQQGTKPLCAALEAAAIEVLVAADARSGFEVAQSQRPSCILLSVELSGSSGYALCNKLRRDPELCRIPLVLASSTATPATFDEHRRLRTHADGYLHKPYVLGTTLTQLATFLPQLAGAAAQHPVDEPPAAPDAPTPQEAPAPPARPLSAEARDLVENAVDLHASTQMLTLAQLHGPSGASQPSPSELIGEALADLGHSEPVPEPISSKLELPLEPTPPPYVEAQAPVTAPLASPAQAGDAPQVDRTAAAHHFAAQMSAPWATGAAAAAEAPQAAGSAASSGPQAMADDAAAPTAHDEQQEALAALRTQLEQAQTAQQQAESALAELTQRHDALVSVVEGLKKNAARAQALGAELQGLFVD